MQGKATDRKATVAVSTHIRSAGGRRHLLVVVAVRST
jgi:hypothetical protein